MSDEPAERGILVRGERVGLGRVLRGDIPHMARWFEDLSYSTNLGRPGMFLSIEDETKWYEENAAAWSEARMQFAIIELATGRHVGNAGLFDIHQGRGAATFGIGIGLPEARGRGYGTEATRLTIEYGFFFRSLWHIGLSVGEFNLPGITAYRRAGFRECGRYRGRWIVGGRRFDEVLMEITRDEVDLTRIAASVPLLADAPPHPIPATPPPHA